MAKILCVLYDDPIDGYPTTYARDGIPKLERGEPCRITECNEWFRRSSKV